MAQMIKKPSKGEAITVASDFRLCIPDHPIIPFIEGDGIGADITPVMRFVVDAALKKAYGHTRSIEWLEIYAGEKATHLYGSDVWLPDETLEAIKEFSIAIKGPLTTPVSGGIRSINVALRQQLDLYVCLRPVRYFDGVPSPLKNPEKTNMVLFRENSEDIYAGIEWQADSPEAKSILDFLQDSMKVKNIRFPEHCGVGIKPISKQGSQRLIRRAIQYALDHHLPSVTLVHKGNIMKFTEGAFKNWGYELAQKEFNAVPIDQGPWMQIKNPNTQQSVVIKDVIADSFLQQILLRPDEYSVIATTNLNGDYISDALAAQVGGIGIAPGLNSSDRIMVFEATHGTAPKYAGQDKVNPGSLILSAEMMLRQMQWHEAADCIINGIKKAFQDKVVTYDFARLMSGIAYVSCSQFGKYIVENM